jgi:hypothetical protein
VAYFAVTVAHGPAWDASRPMREQDEWHAHARYMDQLVDEGFIVLGGPVAGGDGPARDRDDRTLGDPPGRTQLTPTGSPGSSRSGSAVVRLRAREDVRGRVDEPRQGGEHDEHHGDPADGAIVSPASVRLPRASGEVSASSLITSRPPAPAASTPDARPAASEPAM